MKLTALLFALLLATACASPTAVIDRRDLDCRGGQDVGIAAAFEDARRSEQVGQPSFVVEVANNSHADVTVTSVKVEPSQRNRVRYATAFDGDDVTIAGGDAHVYRLPATAPLAPDPEISRAPLDRLDRALALFVTVALSNGDHYRCEFFVPLED
jgi:hypothetical protein